MEELLDQEIEEKNKEINLLNDRNNKNNEKIKNLKKESTYLSKELEKYKAF